MMLSFIKDLKAMYGINVKCERSNKAGENEDFKSVCKHEGMGVQFENTTSGTLQHNGRVKQIFTTLFNRVCAMLNGGKFSSFLRNGLWAEAANIVTLLKNKPLAFMRDLSPFQQFFESEIEAS